jgi:hypothetical protein
MEVPHPVPQIQQVLAPNTYSNLQVCRREGEMGGETSSYTDLFQPPVAGGMATSNSSGFAKHEELGSCQVGLYAVGKMASKKNNPSYYYDVNDDMSNNLICKQEPQQGACNDNSRSMVTSKSSGFRK